MDTFALGLIKAAQIMEDGRIDEFVKNRYASFSQGIGAKIREKKVNLQELSDYALAMKKPELPSSGSQEYLESVFNSILYRG